MDHLGTTIGPDKEQRARNVARDPYAAAKYFHFLIRIVLETLCGIKASSCSVETQEGVFGGVAGYFGTVESQGRGSLHLHLFLYLTDVPSSTELEHMLETEDFRNQLVSFLKENIHAEIPGLQIYNTSQTMWRLHGAGLLIHQMQMQNMTTKYVVWKVMLHGRNR